MKNILFEKQDMLQKGALEILESLDVISQLSQYGNVKIVGSMALGLMTWKDIDVDVVVEKLNEKDYLRAVGYFFNKPGVKRIVLADNRVVSKELEAQGIPSSMYMGLVAGSKGGDEWKMDVRFVVGSMVRAEKYIKEIKEKLSDEKREIILEIKNAVCSSDEYIKKKISAFDIYDAVLNRQVENLEEFKKILTPINK